jgi:hypothetical protein
MQIFTKSCVLQLFKNIIFILYKLYIWAPIFFPDSDKKQDYIMKKNISNVIVFLNHTH